MKAAMIITGMALAGVVGYFVFTRWMKNEPGTTPRKSHHLTDVFSRAKDLAMHN